MKTWLLSLTLAVLLPALDAQTASRDERWRQDLQALTTTLTQRHPNLFANISRADFDRVAAEISDSVPQRSDADLTVDFMRLIAMAGDSHTYVNPYSGLSPLGVLPLRVRWFSDGLFIITATPPYARALGKRIVAIGDMPLDEAYARVKTVIAHENDYWARFRSEDYLITPNILFTLGIVAAPDNVPFTFDDGAGGTFTLTVARVSGATLQAPHNARMRGTLAGRYPQLNYWFDYIEPSKTLYMQYNACVEQASLAPAEFSREILTFYLENPVDRVVLDLRNNAGGNQALISQLLAGFGELLLTGRLPDTLKLYALIGGRTFSSGAGNAMDMKRVGFTLAGTPTGGKPDHFGETQAALLPNSRLLFQFSTRWSPNPDFPGDALRPDILVETTSADYFAERDPVLDRVLQ